MLCIIGNSHPHVSGVHNSASRGLLSNTVKDVIFLEPFYSVRDFKTLREMLNQSLELFADRPAFEVKKGDIHYELTYTEYMEQLNALCNAFLDMGMYRKRIGVISDNRYKYVLTYMTAICSGNCAVPIDKELMTDDIHGIIEAAGCSMLFVDQKHIDKIDFDRLGDIPVYCYDPIEDAENVHGIRSFTELHNYGRELSAQGKKLWETIDDDPNEMCVLLFTSGTTGVSKGVMLCQNNFIFEIKAAMGVIKISPEDCGISLLPLHHTFESSIILFFAPYCGAKVTFCEGFKYVLRNMKEFNPTVFVAVPLVLETVHKRILKKIKEQRFGEAKFKLGLKLCKAGNLIGLDLSKIIFKEIQDTFGGHMRMIICGGAAVDPKVLDDFNTFGIQIIYGYGLTECAPLAIINHDRLRTTDSIGEPLPGVETKLINQDENGIGELCVKGGMVMLGYYNNPEATAEVVDSDGFLHTGDLVSIDKKGHYHVCGRSKNVIVTSNGKNIYPEELEYHLDGEDCIHSSLVEGVENQKGEIEVHAQILPDMEEIKQIMGKEPTDEELDGMIRSTIKRINAKVPSFKRIHSFTIRKNDFERTTAQKIKRINNKVKERLKNRIDE